MTTQSGNTSPGGSNSISNSSVRTTRTTEDEEGQVAPHNAFHMGCCSSPETPERDEESDGQCCDDDEALSRLALASELFRHDSSIGVQTEYNDEFPPLRFLRALGEDPTGFIQQQQAFYFTGSSDVVPAPLLHLQQPSQQNNNNHPPPSQLPIPTLSAATTNVQQSTNTASANTAINTASAANNASVAMDASSSCSDGTLQLVIQNFRHMSDTVRGPCKYIQTVPWRIMVMPRQHVVQKKGTQKCLGFFLQCCPDAYSESWSCQASAELRLISQKAGIPNFIRKTNHVYTSKENDWGYSCFMTWADILDESQGYIKDDKVTLEVSVKADPPKNILTHSEFKKKIQDYKRLADLQCQRGLIDKAIDCNTQALKFCKDKDPQCKTELEAQKAHLIDMKLKQSIQRIEKGGDPSKIDDDSTTNLNALRQAMGTATRCGGSKATKNKSTSTKDSNSTTTIQNSNNNNNNQSNDNGTIVVDKKQRAGTPPFVSPNKDGENKLTLKQGSNKTMKTVETNEGQQQQQKIVNNKISEGGGGGQKQQQQHSISGSKKRLYKSASTNELGSIGEICKEEFDFMKDRYHEEEDLLPDQIKHFLKHLSEGDKDGSRLKEQIAKLELIASPFEKPDPLLLEGIMKLTPEEADKALVKAITFYALERENERERGIINDPNQLDRLEKVIRNKFCESCLHEGHIQIEKRETSDSGCQTEFAGRIPREAIPADDATLRIMQQLQQQQQHLLGQHATNEEYINALKTQAFAAVQQQQQQQNIQQNNQTIVNVPTRRKKAAAKKGLQQQQKQQQQQQQQLQQNLLQQQQQLQQQFIQVANARAVQQQQQQVTTDQSNVGSLVDAMNLDLSNPQISSLFSNKQMLNPVGIDMNLAALTNLDLSKIHFSSSDPVTLSETNAANMQGNNTNNSVFSRQYIEEWLRYNTRHLLKANFDDKQQQQQPSVASSISASSMPGGSNSDNNVMASIVNQIYSVDPQDVTSTQAALFQLHCLNAKNIQNKVDEFVQTLETHANFRDLRNCIDRLLTICADDENFTSAEDTVSVISVSECSGREFDANKEVLQDFSTLSRSFIEEDPHDYILLRELKQQEIMLSTRLNSILYQLHQASISDIVDRIEAKFKVLDDKLKHSKNECATLKANDKKINDQLALVQKEFQGINGKYEKLTQQLKDRKNEIKKLEKKAKSEAFMQERLDELQERYDANKKELAAAQRQLSEEQSKYKRDTQSLADSKKHLNTELNAKYSEIQKLNTSLDEKTQALKKLESQLSNERKNNNQTVLTLTERVKRAEVNLLEHKLEDGLRILERAKDDCSAQIKVLEAEKQKRSIQSEIDVIKWNIGEWESKREEVASLISQAKTEFASHIQAVKSGKQLMQLPKLQVPKPPPCPRIHPMPPPLPPPSQQQQQTTTTTIMPSTPNSTGITQQQQQQVPPSPLSLDQKAITPPGKARIGGDVNTTTTPQQQQQNTTAQHKHHQSTPLSSTSSITTMTTPVKASGPLGLGGGPSLAFQSLSSNRAGIGCGNSLQQQQQQQQPLQLPPHLPPPIAPIGVRPSNYQNGISVPPPSVVAGSGGGGGHPPSAAAVAHHKFATAVAQQIGHPPPSQSSSSNQLQRHSPQLLTSHQNTPQQQQQFIPSQQSTTILSQQSFQAIGQPHQQTISSSSLRHQQQQLPTTPQQQCNNNNNTNNIVIRPSPSFQTWNGGWGDQLNHMNNISDIFGQGRSFGPLGSEFGGQKKC